MLGLLPPTSGTVNILGFDIRTQALEARAHIGYLPEHDCLPAESSATDFVTHMGRMAGLPSTEARERAAETLRHVGLHEERYRLIGSYSTGMKQRVKLAQALVHDPKLVLLDEPTNGLDPEGRDEMLGLVQRVGHDFGISVIVTSHLLGEIEQVCDHLVVLEEGKLRYDGSVSAFTKQTEFVLVDVDEHSEAFATAARAAGLTVEPEGHELRVALAGESTYDTIRDVAADLGAPLVRVELKRHNLGDLFRVGGGAISG
jgi:ABC-2 type transport system ATP-binding protein